MLFFAPGQKPAKAECVLDRALEIQSKREYGGGDSEQKGDA